jgi:hypothetical protein
MTIELTAPLPTTSVCPICADKDAFVEPFPDGDEYYVECVNCNVYRASRKALRHFEYLRWRDDPEGLTRLARLAAALHARGRTIAARLEYDTWNELCQP